MVSRLALFAAFGSMLAAASAAGCITADPEEARHGELKPPGYRLGGSFAAGATGEDIEQVRARAHDAGGIMWTVDKQPPDFDILGIQARSDCQALRAFAVQADYVGLVGECRWWE